MARRDNHGLHEEGQLSTTSEVEDYQLHIGGPRTDVAFGTDDMTIAFGRGGSDYLSGGGMEDDLQGGVGNDVLLGGDSGDHLEGGSGSDILIAGADPDEVRGGTGADYLHEGDGHGDVDGEQGNDLLIGGRGGDAFILTPDSGRDVILDFQAGPGIFDHLALRDISPEELRFQDTFAGVRVSWNEGRASVLLAGVFKADLTQDDFMFANDRQVIQPTTGDSGQVMAMSFAKDEGGALSAPEPPSFTTPSETFRFDEFSMQFGTDGADALQGTADRDFRFGLAGNDILFGGAADDDLKGDEGDDVLDGGDGRDHLMGGAGDDSLFGGAMTDSLMGGDGNDTIFAGAGHDMVEGEGGDDRLNGGDGADAFVVSFNSGNDVVTGGFDAGPGAFDHIAFRGILADQVRVENATRDDSTGVLVSWGTDADAGGSIFIVGLAKDVMAQDDFMFDADTGVEGAFLADVEITTVGSQYIFQDPVAMQGNVGLFIS